MKRKILSAAVLQQMIARNHPMKNQRRHIGFVALADEILVRAQRSSLERELFELGDIFTGQARMLLQLARQDLDGVDHPSLLKLIK